MTEEEYAAAKREIDARMNDLLVEQTSLPRPVEPTTITPASMAAYRLAVDRYCDYFDRLDAEFVATVAELAQLIRAAGDSSPGAQWWLRHCAEWQVEHAALKAKDRPVIRH